MHINFLSAQRHKSFRLPAGSQVIDPADMYDDNIKGRKWKSFFQILITVMLINGLFFPFFCLNFQADTVTDPI